MSKQTTTTSKRSRRLVRRGPDGRFVADGSENAFQFGELIKDREVECVVGAVVAGFCLGALLGTTMSRSTRQDSWTDRVTAEGLGRKLMENLQRIPGALSERLHK